jgi:hypothetical protein
MKRCVWAVAGLSAVVAVASAVLVGAQGLPTQLPLEPARETGQSVTGAYEGWYQNPDGTYSMLVGYFNRNTKEELEIPVGPNNRIEPGGPDQGQPTHFLTRRQWGMFSITVPKDFGKNKLTWTLVSNGQTTSIPLTLDPQMVVEPFKDQAMGNTPPVVKFELSGPSIQGPPRGIAVTKTAKVTEPLALMVWASDDAHREEGRPQRPGPPQPPVRLSWSKFRGPGEVKFDKARPDIDFEDAGKATTTATFTAPGEYILRVQANDSTGEGGGGFQCCWTSAHVKVTVTP